MHCAGSAMRISSNGPHTHIHISRALETSTMWAPKWNAPEPTESFTMVGQWAKANTTL